MSLPLKQDPNTSPPLSPLIPQEKPGPKIVAIESYDPVLETEDFAAEEAEVVARMASEALENRVRQLHNLGERITRTCDALLQETATAARRGLNTLHKVAEDDPIRFVAVIAGAAFLTGFLLRVGRSTRG